MPIRALNEDSPMPIRMLNEDTHQYVFYIEVVTSSFAIVITSLGLDETSTEGAEARKSPLGRPKLPSASNFMYAMPQATTEVEEVVAKCLMRQISISQGAKILKVYLKTTIEAMHRCKHVSGFLCSCVYRRRSAIGKALHFVFARKQRDTPYLSKTSSKN